MLLGASNVKKTPISLLTPAVQGEGTMGLEPDQAGGAGDCFVWFVGFCLVCVVGIWLTALSSLDVLL